VTLFVCLFVFFGSHFLPMTFFSSLLTPFYLIFFFPTHCKFCHEN
jgi:hypothetical protein